MVCFDTNSNIVKYNCVGAIMEAYYGKRLEAYEQRRQNEMGRLKREAVEYDAKARFIQAVIKGQIELRSATDEAIVVAMKEHKLPPISKPDDADSVDAYEYLLKMRMDRVKAAAVVEQQKAAEAAAGAVAVLEATTATMMWKSDLAEFAVQWRAMRKRREEALADVDGKKRSTASSKKKFTVKKA